MVQATQSASDLDEENGIEIIKVVVATPLPLSSAKSEPNISGLWKRAADESGDPLSKRLFAAPLSVKPEPLNLDGIFTKDEIAARIAEKKAMLLAQIKQLDLAASSLLNETVVPETKYPVECRSVENSLHEETVVDESEVAFVGEVIINKSRKSFKPDFAAMLKLQEDTRKLALEEREKLKAETEAKDAEVARLEAEAFAEHDRVCDESRWALEEEEKRRKADDEPLIPLLKKEFGTTDIIGFVKDVLEVLLPDGFGVSDPCQEFLVIVSTDAVAQKCRNHVRGLKREEEKFLSVESCRLYEQREVPEKLKDRVKLLSSMFKIRHRNPKLRASIETVGKWIWRDDVWCENEELARQLSSESPPWSVITQKGIYVSGLLQLSASEKAVEEKRKEVEKEQQKVLRSLGEKEKEVRSWEQLVEIKKEKIDKLQQTQKLY